MYFSVILLYIVVFWRATSLLALGYYVLPSFINKGFIIIILLLLLLYRMYITDTGNTYSCNQKLEPLRGTYQGPVGLGIPLLFKYFAPVPPGSVEANVDLFYNQRQFVHLLRCK